MNRILIISSGALITLISAIILIMGIKTILPSGADSGFIFMFFVVSSLMVLLGIAGILVPVTGNIKLLKAVNKVGIKIGIVSTALFCAALYVNKGSFLPMYESIFKPFGLEITAGSNIFIYSVTALAIGVHFLYRGIIGFACEEDDDLIVKSITRLIMIVAAGLFFIQGIDAAVDGKTNISIFSYTFFILLGLLMFKKIRQNGDGVMSIIIRTIIFAVAFFILVLLIYILGGVINRIFNLGILVPVIAIGIVIFLLDYVPKKKTSTTNGELCYKGRDANGKKIYEIITPSGRIFRGNLDNGIKGMQEMVRVRDVTNSPPTPGTARFTGSKDANGNDIYEKVDNNGNIFVGNDIAGWQPVVQIVRN